MEKKEGKQKQFKVEVDDVNGHNEGKQQQFKVEGRTM